MSRAITMYSTTWCGYCRRLKRELSDEGISYREVDIERHTEHGAKIEAATGGFRTVPTLEVDGRLLVNPSLREVKQALADN